MAKRKKGSIAIPFLLTFFIAILAVGGIGLFVFDYIQKSKQVELSEPVGKTAGVAEYEDSHTILFILDTPDKKCKSTFMLIRSIPKEKKILCVGVPSNSIQLMNGVQYSIGEYYESGGGSYACEFIAQQFGIDTPKYVIFDEEAFCKLSDIMGGVSYAVSVDIQGFDDSNTEQFLNGKQIVTLLTYPLFKDGEKQRASIVGSLMSSMINQADGTRIADSLDRIFNTLIDMVTTNITAVDYKEKKDAIQFMFNYGTTISRFRMATGVNTGDYFLMDESFPEEIKSEYFKDYQSGKSEKNE